MFDQPKWSNHVVKIAKIHFWPLGGAKQIFDSIFELSEVKIGGADNKPSYLINKIFWTWESLCDLMNFRGKNRSPNRPITFSSTFYFFNRKLRIRLYHNRFKIVVSTCFQRGLYTPACIREQVMRLIRISYGI